MKNDTSTISYYNRNFYIVFEPKKNEVKNNLLIKNRRRFLIGFGQLENYIGKENSNKVKQKALNLSDDKIRLKFRKYGIIDIYNR